MLEIPSLCCLTKADTPVLVRQGSAAASGSPAKPGEGKARQRACLHVCRDALGEHSCVHDPRRVTLVQLLFESASADPIPETDPELRAALLDSLKTYEAQERGRPAFTQHPQVPVPEAAHAHAHAPAPGACPSSPLSNIPAEGSLLTTSATSIYLLTSGWSLQCELIQQWVGGSLRTCGQ